MPPGIPENESIMARTLHVFVLIATLACAGTVRQEGYVIRVLGARGNSGSNIEVDDVEIDLSVSPLSKNRQDIDVKARVHNTGSSKLKMTRIGAKLESNVSSWTPEEWKAYRGDVVVTDSVIVEPHAEWGILCAFHYSYASFAGNPRGRFPRTLKFTIGEVLREGKAVELGTIQLYMPE